MITNENYFSKENELKYMGSTQFKNFMDCEARALATIKGEFETKQTVAMLIGSYIDAHFEGTLDIFKAQHPEIFTQKGTLKADFKHAEYIIERISRDEMFMRYMSGEKQVIKTGEIEGVPVKIKIDSYHEKKVIVDLKIMKDFSPIWKEGQGKLNFIEAWGYDVQGAMYQKIEGNNLPFYIAGATKEDEPDLGIFSISEEVLTLALESVKTHIRRFDDIKKGLIEPVRCEKCDYCKRTKVLKDIISLEDLQYE